MGRKVPTQRKRLKRYGHSTETTGKCGRCGHERSFHTRPRRACAVHIPDAPKRGFPTLCICKEFQAQ